MKEFQEELEKLQKDNMSLRIRIYKMEQDMGFYDRKKDGEVNIYK